MGWGGVRREETVVGGILMCCTRSALMTGRLTAGIVSICCSHSTSNEEESKQIQVDQKILEEESHEASDKATYKSRDWDEFVDGTLSRVDAAQFLHVCFAPLCHSHLGSILYFRRSQPAWIWQPYEQVLSRVFIDWIDGIAE